MPNTDEPEIEKWVPFLAKQVKNPDKDTYFIGHSIGCQTILRYLETAKGKIGGIVFVAPWFNLKNLEPEEKSIAKPWLEIPIDCKKILTRTKRIVAIFSDNDEVVPLNDSKIFKKKLKAKVIIERKKGHFNDRRYPTILKLILGLIKA